MCIRDRSAPAFTFKNDDDTGMYGSANRIHFAVSGNEKIQVQPSSIILYESTTIQNELKVGTIPQIVITSSRALQNISSISSGAIASTGTISTTGQIEAGTNLQLGSGYNLSWGGAYASGKPTIAANANTMYFYPTGNVSGQRLYLNASGLVNAGTFTSGAISSSGAITGTSFTTTGGARVVNVASGTLTMKGDTGGWAFGLHALGSSNTNHGGFGFLGGADSLSLYYIGESYSHATNFRFYKSGQLNIGTTTILDLSLIHISEPTRPY